MPAFLKSKEQTIAIRCPNHAGLKKILKPFNGLFSTSANRSNQPIPQNYVQIDSKILSEITLIVVEKKDIDTNNNLNQTLPSTIIDVANCNNVKIIREGALKLKELEDSYGEKFVK